jgi:hypothetical protein
MRTVLSTLLASSLAVGFAAADITAYARVRDLQADGDTFTVRHHHDWSKAKKVAFVTWHPRGESKVLRKEPSPALTWLGVSPDSRFVIGLSSIKHRNEHQLAVWDRDGKLLTLQKVAGRGLPYVSESMTNAVYWFDRDPSPTVVLEGDQPVALRFRAVRTGAVTELRFIP